MSQPARRFATPTRSARFPQSDDRSLMGEAHGPLSVVPPGDDHRRNLHRHRAASARHSAATRPHDQPLRRLWRRPRPTTPSRLRPAAVPPLRRPTHQLRLPLRRGRTMNPYTPYSGRAFGTRVIRPTRAIWAPLERVARLSRSTDELLSFHEGEFMYMLGVRNSR